MAFNIDNLSIDHDLPAFVAMLKKDELQLTRDITKESTPDKTSPSGVSKQEESEERYTAKELHSKKSPGLSKYEEYENRPVKPLNKKSPRTNPHHAPSPRTAFSPDRRGKRSASPTKKGRQPEAKKTEVSSSSKEDELFNSAEVEKIRAIANTRRGRRAHSVGQHDEARVEAEMMEYQAKKKARGNQLQNAKRSDAWVHHHHHHHNHHVHLDRDERPLPTLAHAKT